LSDAAFPGGRGGAFDYREERGSEGVARGSELSLKAFEAAQEPAFQADARRSHQRIARIGSFETKLSQSKFCEFSGA